jgi:transposase
MTETQRWVPDPLWEITAPLIPAPPQRPQGGGSRRVDDRAVLAAIVYVAQTGCSWWKLPAGLFGVTRATAHRRFTEWTQAGLWSRLHEAVLDQLGRAGSIGWDRAALDSISIRAEKKGHLTGPSPVDRGKPGSKIHLLTEAAGLPLATLISGANTHDSQLMLPVVDAVPAIAGRRGRPRRRPGKLHADKAYDQPALRAGLRRRGITARIARRGIESATRLGRHPSHIERSFSWLMRYRRLVRRYDRLAEHFHAFVTIACALICHHRLTKTSR